MLTVSPVIADISELTNDWLSNVLEATVETVEATQIVGEGYASRMYRLVLQYGLDEQRAHPKTLILKLCTDNKQQSELFEDNVLFREVYFYTAFGDKLADMLPKIYFSRADFDAKQLTLLMEDLGEIPHKGFCENLENAKDAMRILARAHAAFWNSELLEATELVPVDSELEVEALIVLLEENLVSEHNAEYSYPYLTKCIKNLLKTIKWIVGEADRFKGPVTLNHGDFHSRNVFFSSDRAVIFDWQQAERGKPVRDVIYWLITSVETKNFNEYKPVLIEAYLKGLRDNGIEGYDKKAFMRDFTETAFQLIPRVYCYQTLIDLSDEDQHELQNFLDNAELLAKENHMLAALRAARVFAPLIMTILKWIGKR